MTKIANCKVAKRRIFQCLTNLREYATNELESASLSDVEIRLERLESLESEFQAADLYLTANGIESEYTQFEEFYYEIKSALRNFVKQQAQASHNQHNETLINTFVDRQSTFLDALNRSSNQQQQARLPKINIPIFHGDYKEWPAFKDLYLSCVGTRTDLTDSVKLQFLKGALKGEASKLISHLYISDVNYNQAWEKLVNRYDKKRHIVSAYIKEFINQSNSSNSISSLRSIADTSDQLIRGIDVLGRGATDRNPWLIYIILNKLDNETKRAWAAETSDEDFPSFDTFITFLNKRCDALETVEPIKKGNNQNPQSIRNHHLQTITCPKCLGDHQLYKCGKYKEMNVMDRRKFIKEKSLCFNCLSTGHNSSRCKSKFKCKSCNNSHHTTLHITDYQPPTEIKSHQSSQPLIQPSSSSSSSIKSTQDNPYLNHITAHTLTQTINTVVLLPTAVVNVLDANDQLQPCRVLLDSGSQASFISEDCAYRLHLKREKSKISVRGLSSTKPVFTKGLLSIKLLSRIQSKNSITIKAHILDKLTAPQPQRSFNATAYQIFQQYPLADPDFNKSRKIDIIIGADYFFQLIQDGKIQPSTNLPFLQNTIFGYILAGEISNDHQNHYVISLHTDITSIDNTLKQFWEVEELPPNTTTFSEEESYCENQFVNTHYIDEKTNKYVVRLPLIDKFTLGNSLSRALSCLSSQERRTCKNPELRHEYLKFMSEYENLSHMEIIPSSYLLQEKEHMYLPHHAVIKPSSTTTKVRVVFNGSAVTANGTSLNQKLLVGPKTQRDLVDILLSFRTFKVAVVADVEKMYRQILVHPDDRNYQRIVWRTNSSEPVSHFFLNTVTYGTSSAPFLATRALKQLTVEFKDQYPLAERAIKNNFYVDDLLGGAETLSEANELYHQLTNLLSQRGFTLRKWNSNSQQFLTTIAAEHRNSQSLLIDNSTETLRVLGLKWIPGTDHFSYEVSFPEETIPTKRVILSESSRVFDPLGLISPVTVLFKILFQKLWLQKCDWDEYDETIGTKWKTLRNSLQQLNNLQIPRFLNTNSADIELHGFSDASELAYAAVIYCRATDKYGNVNVNLTMSKTKVSPITQLSIPRLELCAAVLLTKLFQFVLENVHVSIEKCFAWTDSTVVLSWLSDHPRKWKCFVANRTSFILTHIPNAHWYHVRSSDNPADVASRGLTPQNLINSHLWWSGPTWLKGNWNNYRKSTKPVQILNETYKTELRERYIDILHIEIENDTLTLLFKNYSNLSKIARILSRCFQFIRYCRKSSVEPKSRLNLTSSIDIQNAYNSLCKWSQKEAFHEEIKSLKPNSTVRSSSIMSPLSPFLDDSGLLRVGGRLEHAAILYNAKHPIILPKDNIFVHYLINHIHQKHLHAAVTLLLNIIRQEYWIISCRRLVKGIINKCVTCVRHRGRTSQQLMANLPLQRLGATRAFSVVGVDYAGPLELLNRRGRGARVVKGYIALFICFSTRAIHLELSSDLSTDAFISCFKRFIARRGVPAKVYSDNGTNFVGANRLLNELQNNIKNFYRDSSTLNFISENKISWSFNPPSAPHFGGLWEAGVKSVKSILLRVTTNIKLTYEEMNTVLIQIEGLLNSRPLAPITDDPSNLCALTPAHFLIGQPITSLPESTDCQLNLRDRWRITQRLQQNFWNRWYHEYLTLLQQRPKWQKANMDINIGDLVTIKDDGLPTGKWKLGRVIETHKGADKLVRVATVRTASSIIKRPVTKLCKLPTASVKTALNGAEDV